MRTTILPVLACLLLGGAAWVSSTAAIAQDNKNIGPEVQAPPRPLPPPAPPPPPPRSYRSGLSSGEPSDAVFRVDPSPDGTALILSGTLMQGATAKVRRVLKQNPKVGTLVLSSPGGLVFEGAAMGALVQSAGLATHAEGVCASACTQVLVSGKRRTMAGDARVGFHQPWQPALFSFTRQSSGTKPELSFALMQRVYQRAGVQAAFVTKILATPSKGMWFPPTTEMQNAGVITGIADLKSLGVDAGRHPVRKAVIADLRDKPFWKSAFATKAEAVNYGVDTVYMDRAMRRKSDYAETAGIETISLMLLDDVPSLPDDVVAAIPAMLLDRMGDPEVSPPSYCNSGLLNVRKGANRADPSKLEQDFLLSALAASRVTTRMTDQEAVNAAADFMLALATNGDGDKITDVLLSFRGCEQMRSMMGGMLKLPAAERARVLRGIIIYLDRDTEKRPRISGDLTSLL